MLVAPSLGIATHLFNQLPKREAPGEGGLISGTNPTAFTTSDPLRLWIIQVGIIITMTQLLSLGLRNLRQPKVIAEIVGGILLGPTALGRIPGFTKSIFPSVSLPYLTLTADIGLCLFLFLVGLEIDTSVIRRNASASVIVSLVGIALPFGLGTALSVPLYHRFTDPSVHFAHFTIFTGVAYSITSFTILCRILTELNLLDTNIGIIALSAGIGNDIVGLTLLALSVALVNAGSSLSAVWILLSCMAFTIFLLGPVKLVMHWLARMTGSIENGPSMFYMIVIMILVWACSFFTDSIGVDAIFGAFLAGVIIPREGGLAISLTEKLEDMVSIVFLPIFFTLSGLNANLGLLNNGITWAFTIAIIVLAFFGKFGGCAIACKVAGYSWRESCTIGTLMNCKGLVELIVLNVGLEAGILSQRVFTMFYLEAVTVTFIATPLVMRLYPPECRTRDCAVEGGESVDVNEKVAATSEDQPWRHRFTVVLNKVDHIPGVMALTQLILPHRNVSSDVVSSTAHTLDETNFPEVSVDALQLIELSDRTSAVMKSIADGLIHIDPVLDIFRMFGELNGLTVRTTLSVVPYDDFAQTVAEHGKRHAAHLILLPWLPPGPSSIDAPHQHDVFTPRNTIDPPKPFDVQFGGTSGKAEKSPSATYSKFIRGVFSQSKMDVAVFIDAGSKSNSRVGGPTHVFLPFFGGPNDRLALEFVVQLCLNPRMTATVVRMMKHVGAGDAPEVHPGEEPERPSVNQLHPGTLAGLTIHSNGSAVTSTTHSVYPPPTPQTRHQSETADNVAWSKYTVPSPDASPALRQTLARIHFSEVHTSAPINTAIQRALTLAREHQRLLIVVGLSKRLAIESHHEIKQVIETHQPGWAADMMRKTVGDIGAAMVLATSGTVVVMQAAEKVSEGKEENV